MCDNNNNPSPSPTSPTLPSPRLTPAPTETILDIWEQQRHHASSAPPRSARAPSARRHQRIPTALATATAYARHTAAHNTAYLSFRALESWTLQHCACPATTFSSSCCCSDPSCAAADAAAHHAPDDHAALIAHALRRGMADGTVWVEEEAETWFRELAVSAARLAGEEGEELARLGAGLRRAGRGVMRARDGLNGVERAMRGGEGWFERGERESGEALKRAWGLGSGEEDEVVKVREQAELMRVPLAYKVAVGALEGWVRGMEKRYKNLLGEMRGAYAEIAERDGNLLAQSFAEALDGSAVLAADRLMMALGWTQADLDAGVSTINSATSQGRPGSPWHQLIITSIPHIGGMLRDVHFAAYRLSHPTTRDGSWKDGAPVLAKLRQALDRYHTWTMANFDRIHVQLCARLAEMQADPIYYDDPLHATVRSAFKSTTGLFVSTRVKPFLPLGVNKNCFARVLRQLEPQHATLPPRLRADYDMMRSVVFFYNLGIEAHQKRAQCDNALALVLPDALDAHRNDAVRTATARWQEYDAKHAEVLDSVIESAEQLDAHSIAARDVLAALRDGESFERAADLAMFGNLMGPRGRFIVELLACAIDWRDRAADAKAHARRVERFHALWTRPKRTVQMPFRPH